jgi:hypothetical protein
MAYAWDVGDGRSNITQNMKILWGEAQGDGDREGEKRKERGLMRER